MRIAEGLLAVKKSYKNLSLKRKLFLFYSVLFVLPLLLISVIIYAEVSRSMLEKMRFSASQSYMQSKSYLEFKIMQFIQRSDVVVTNAGLKDQIRTNDSVKLDSHAQIALKEGIRSYLQSVEGNTGSIRVKLYLYDRHEFMADGDYILKLSDADNALWYGKKGSQKVYFAPGACLEEERGEHSVALVRDIMEESDYRKRMAVLRMDIDIEEFRVILQNATPTENAVSYLVNRENQVVAVSDGGKLEANGLGGSLPEEFSYSRYADASGLTEGRLGKNQVFYMRNKVRNTDWEMITVIPGADMVSGVSRLQYMVAGLMLLFGVLTIAGGTFLVSWITRRISRLIENINLVKQGDMTVKLVDDTRDEIGVLYANYNEMLVRTNELMDEKYRMGVSLKSAELKALQSQINPHFLYNTLDMVNWLAFAGRTDDIHSAVVSLSKYYRLILNKGRDTLTLREELQHVGYYMKIQDIRFPGRIRYEERVAEAVLESIVPKIILQPLVENAIQHGIWEKEGKRGEISIEGGLEPDGGTVCIRVQDDGVGMDEFALSHVLDGSLRTSGSGYGVKNVNARLQLMFGPEYGLRYQGAESGGTCVEVRFPAGNAPAD